MMKRKAPPIEVLEARIAPAFAPVFDLAALNGSNGFSIPGMAAGNTLGQTVSGAGDVNGDGFDDIIIGASGISEAYVVFGKATGFDPECELSSLNGINGFRLNAGSGGIRVGATGDVNGDGYDDLLIGTSNRAYVVFGKEINAPNLHLGFLDAANGFRIFNSERPFLAELGRVGNAGDINGDGFDDIIVGDRLDPGEQNGNFPGAAFVIFGKASGFGDSFDVQSLNGQNGFRLNGSGERSYVGLTVSGAGDVNGDGFDDLLVGGSKAQPAYLIYGKGSSFPAKLNLAELDGSNGTVFGGNMTVFGAFPRVARAGDLNGDGLADIIIHAASDVGKYSNDVISYVVFGSTKGFGAKLQLTSLPPDRGFEIRTTVPANSGLHSISGGGDVNGDGFDDLLIGSQGESSYAGYYSGAAYVIFGKSEPFGTRVDLSALNGANGFRVDGLATRDSLGTISNAGDINGDGADDIVIGAQFADKAGTDSGAAYVIFGQAGIRIQDGSVTEGNSGTAQIAFKVTLPKASTLPVTIQYSTRDGSAHAGRDYEGVTDAEITFAPGETEKTIVVSVFGDALYQPDRTFELVLAESPDFPILRGTAIGTIRNDDPMPTVSIGPASAREGSSGITPMTFTVTLSEATGATTTVNYLSTARSATAGQDYVSLLPGTLTFEAGETSKTITVDIIGDTAIEANEVFSVTLWQAVGASISTAAALGTILNDDTALSISTKGSTLENDTGIGLVLFTITLDQPSILPVSVNLSTVDGTASGGSDYEPVLANLTFAPGETSKSYSVAVKGDTELEGNETFSLVLSDPTNAAIANGSATATILNDDTTVQISAPAPIIEAHSGSNSHVFTVSLATPSALTVEISYSTVDETARAGSDYAAETGVLTFAPGETSKTITIISTGDGEIEGDEAFGVVLSNAVNATLANDRATASILNDDTAVSVTSSGSILERGSGLLSRAVFTVSLQEASAFPVSVDFSTLDGTAVAGIDYESHTGTLTFAPGETSKEVLVRVTGDDEVEAHEDFTLILSAPVNAALPEESSRAAVTILNDDTFLSISDASILEGHSGTRSLSFLVSLSAPSALPVSVTYGSAGVTAVEGVDYAPLAAGMLTFAPGEVTATLVVDVLADLEAELTETFSVLISSPQNANLSNDTGTGTILDDDVTLTGKRSATFTDTDGDLVTIRVNKGLLKVENFTLFPSGAGSQLALADFHEQPDFTGASLNFSAKKVRASEAGDGKVHVGFIDAAGVDLAGITLKGDLGRIAIGDPDSSKPALLKLKAGSIGTVGLSTQLPEGNLESTFEGALKSLKLSGDLQASSLSVNGSIGSLTISGSVFGSAIRAEETIGKIKIQGDLGLGQEAPSTISAGGLRDPASVAKAVAISNLTVGGSVNYAQILAGYGRDGAAVNADAGIGKVRVGQNWVASSLAAGVTSGSDGFGSDGGELISGGNKIVARIASVVIKGAVNGSQEPGDYFGFVAEEIRTFKSGSAKPLLNSGPANDLAGILIGSPGDDVRVREVRSLLDDR